MNEIVEDIEPPDFEPQLKIDLGPISYSASVRRSRYRGGVIRRLKRDVAVEAGRTPSDLNGAFESLVKESDMMLWSTRRAARWWGRAYYLLGLPSAILAAVSGATGLASTSGRVPAAIIALVSSGLVSAVTFLDSGVKRTENELLSAKWQQLADEARLRYLQYQQVSLASPGQSAVASTYWSMALELNTRKGELLRREVHIVSFD